MVRSTLACAGPVCQPAAAALWPVHRWCAPNASDERKTRADFVDAIRGGIIIGGFHLEPPL